MPKKAIDPATRLLGNIVIDETTGCWMWQGKTTRFGYGRLKIKGRMCMAHRLSYELFRGTHPGSLFVCHSCDNPGCLYPMHFFLGTCKDNLHDAATKGRMSKGEEHVKAKLTDQQVKDISTRYSQGESSMSLSIEYGVAQPTIRCIVNRTTWKHVERETSGTRRPGKSLPGEQNHQAILTTEQAIEILAAKKAGESRSSLAKRFGVTVYAISDLCGGRSWKHLPRPVKEKIL